MPDASLLEQLFDACAVQADWMRNADYTWYSHPNIANSRLGGTCVTYVAVVLQRIDILDSGDYIWHNSRGQVTGATDDMNIFHPNKLLHNIKDELQAGDIIMDGNKQDTESGSHIFIITGEWHGNNPVVWDNHSGQEGWGAYEYDRNRNVFAVVRLTGANFTPRLTSDGINGNPYWYSRNPFYNAGYGLPNCTCYAWGRFWEIADINHDYSNRPTLSTGDAESWYGFTADGYERGHEPRLGAVICFADGPFSGDGHVAVVERINEDGSIVTSNSAYGGQYFYTQTLRPPNYLPAAGYVFQGFIYNPYAGSNPGPSPSFIQKVWLWKRELYNREEFLIR